MSIVLQGSTSGSITLQEPAVAGSNTISLPASTGTVSLTENFTGSNVSLTANGYQKLPSGVIMQWGTVVLPLNTSETVTLPVTFTTTNYAVTFAPELASGSDPSQVFYIRSKTASSFVAENRDHSSTVTLNWIAIGY
jgi:hypothetical protein